MATKGDVMGKHARIGLLLGASACLLAAMVDWVIDELNEHGNPSAEKLASPLTPVPGRSRPLRGRALGWRSHVTKDAILLTGPLGLGHELELGWADGCVLTPAFVQHAVLPASPPPRCGSGPRSAGSASGSASRRLPPRSGPPLSGRLAGCPRRSPW